ncbi:hypothetical protein LCGC14_2676370 [marine sediment metagenome]|uniref:Uncharacterized protein n=1 Tax=marine sediment metagenome TaxID=412755 RepID=A0A0F9BXK9_9ZZZZ
MGKRIEDLSTDIYNVLDQRVQHEPDTTLAAAYAMRIGGELAKSTLPRNKPREKGKMWASDLGKQCLRQAWYTFNAPQYGEPLTGQTKFKFLYGNLLEEAVLYLAEEAGHTVSHQQYRVEYDVNNDWKISGKIDGLIDNTLMDVKSTSSFGFKRYKDGINQANDSFGYRYQLGYYKEFNNIHPLPSRYAGFVWIDKQNGHIKYTPCRTPTSRILTLKAKEIIKAVDETEDNVVRGYTTEPYGKSGNMKLRVGCSYCPYKERCYKDSNGGKGLRTFLYNQGPISFAEVKREPKTQEIT